MSDETTRAQLVLIEKLRAVGKLRTDATDRNDRDQWARPNVQMAPKFVAIEHPDRLTVGDCHALADLLAAHAETVARLEQALADCQSKRVVFCQWCMERLDLKGLPLIEARQRMRDHEASCAQNPLLARAEQAEAQVAALTAKLLALAPDGDVTP